jgi:5-methylcytosine-specific restriction enzyme subunit McrC
VGPDAVVTVLEHERVPVSRSPQRGSISQPEAEQLARIGQERPGFCTLGYQSVRFAQYAGLVQIGSRVLEVLPKVERGAGAEQGRALLLRMLRLAGVSDVFSNLSTHHALSHAPLLEVFIRAFLDTVAPVVRSGLLRSYQGREENLRVVRGRLQVAQQITRNALRPDQLACSFDELTPDNAWNRSLKAALALVRPWIVNVDLARRWLETYAAFEEVSQVPCDAEQVEALRPDRKTSHYVPAVQWASWILRLLSPSVRAGQNAAPGLLFDMNRLFEAAVARNWSRQLRSQGITILAQHTGVSLATTMDSARRPVVRLRPDLILSRNGERLLIADTKWKRLEVGPAGHLEPSPSDVQQLLAYSAAYACKSVALVYPWHAELAGSRETSYQLPPMPFGAPRLDIICLDVFEDALPARRGVVLPTDHGAALDAQGGRGVAVAAASLGQ